jgi:hypothetical protein
MEASEASFRTHQAAPGSVESHGPAITLSSCSFIVCISSDSCKNRKRRNLVVAAIGHDAHRRAWIEKVLSSRTVPNTNGWEEGVSVQRVIRAGSWKKER